MILACEEHVLPCWKIQSRAEAAKYLHLQRARRMNSGLCQDLTCHSGPTTVCGVVAEFSCTAPLLICSTPIHLYMALHKTIFRLT